MANDPPTDATTNPTTDQNQQRSAPRRIAFLIGEWARAAITITAWAIALAVAATVAFLVLKCLLFIIDLGQQALFP